MPDTAASGAVAFVAAEGLVDCHPAFQLELCSNPDPTCRYYSEDSKRAIESVELLQTIR
jgi:hypothetical protein